MKISKARLGAELILRLDEGYSPPQIEDWANTYFHENVRALDPEVRLILENLMSMSMGPQYTMDKNQLKNLAIRLIKEGLN